VAIAYPRLIKIIDTQYFTEILCETTQSDLCFGGMYEVISDWDDRNNTIEICRSCGEKSLVRYYRNRKHIGK